MVVHLHNFCADRRVADSLDTVVCCNNLPRKPNNGERAATTASDAGGGGGEVGLVVVVIVVIVVFAVDVGTTLVSVRCLVCREGLVVVVVVARDIPSVVVCIRPSLGGSLLPSSGFAPWAAPRPRAFGLRALMSVFLGGCRRCECPGVACRVPVLGVATLVGRAATPTTALLLLLLLPRLSPDLLALAELLPHLSRATAAAARPPPPPQGGDDDVVKLRQAIASAEKTTADRRMGRRTVVVTARCRVEDTM